MLRTALKLSIAIVACLLSISGAASAGGGKGDWRGHDRDGFGAISAADYLTQATNGNRFEIATGQLAADQGGSDAVRALGAMLVRDHTAAQQQVDAVAAQLGVTLPPALDAKTQALVDKLAGRSGEEFDRKWLKLQLWAHQKALGLHLRGAIRGDAPEIRTLAQGALPVITAHLGAVLDLVRATDDDDWNGHHGDDDDDDDRFDRHGSKHGDKRGHHRGRGHDSRHKSRR